MSQKKRQSTEEPVTEDIATLRALEGLRLDDLQAAHWQRAMEGDPEATAAVLDVMDRRAALFGLNLGSDGYDTDDKIDDLDGYLAGKLGVDPAEARGELERRLRAFAEEK